MNIQTLLEKTKIFQAMPLENFTQEQSKNLAEILEKHSELYYQKESPVISDREYDSLLEQLGKLELRFGLLQKDSQKVGSKLTQSSFEKVAHSRPMISLGNTYNAEDLRDFDARVQKLSDGKVKEYMLEFKFDGLGVELIYESGFLVQALTRGNGIVGEDITQNIKQIKNIPHTISKTGRFEVRGEVVMPISSFERLNLEAKKTGDKIFSNPRNAASGSLRVLDIETTRKRDLKFFVYDVSDFGEFESGDYDTMIHFLEQLGFEISRYFKKCFTIEAVIHEIEHFGEIKNQIDFEIDGLVIKVNMMSAWKTIGFTEHHPRYAIAYKFPAEIVTTTLLSVEHSVGRTGTLTPVANLEPVKIGGAMIRRSTLHNYEEVEKLGIKIGDRVFLKRAGEVIPKIISVASTSKTGELISPPIHCPSCESLIIKDVDKVRYYCPNSYSCSAQMVEKISFAVGKHGFDIDGFGEKQVALFYHLGYIKTIGDIFRLKHHRQDILSLDGFREKSVINLLSSIEKVKHMDIVSFLKALGIPGVGKKTAKTLGKYLNQNKRSQETSLWELQKDELEALPDIGPEIAVAVVGFFVAQREMILDILSEIYINTPSKNPQSPLENSVEASLGSWQGKKICITGSFEGYSRDDLIEILEKEGGEFMSSVSAKTDYLLAGDKAGSKLIKATELGVQVLSLEEFLVESRTLSGTRILFKKR